MKASTTHRSISIVIKRTLLSILFIGSLVTANTSTHSRQDYIDQITKKVHSEWRLVKAKDGWTCAVNIIQDKEGNILDSNISECNTEDKRFISQLQKAISNSSPLPKAPEGLFSSTITIHPRIKGDINVIEEIKRRYRGGDPIAIKLVRDVREGIYSRGRYAHSLRKLRQMYKDGNPIAIEVIDSIEKMINKPGYCPL